jgi:hypothetical protein
MALAQRHGFRPKPRNNASQPTLPGVFGKAGEYKRLIYPDMVLKEAAA